MKKQIFSPFQTFLDKTGKPLGSGKVWIGVAGIDPKSNPQPIFWDQNGIRTASQPVAVLNGTFANSNSKGKIFVGADYSITVEDAFGNQIYAKRVVKIPSDLVISDYFKSIADIYVDNNSVTTGTISDLATLTTDGKLQFTFVNMDTGTGIRKQSDGLRFYGGKSFRFIGGGQTYEAAMIVADVTFHGPPTTSVGYVFDLEIDPTSRQEFRYTATPLFQFGGPNYVVENFDNSKFDDRQVLAMFTDPQNNILTAPDDIAVISFDGKTKTGQLGAGTTNIVLNDLRIGRNADITIHKIAVFLRPVNGQFPISPIEAWETMAERKLPVYETGYDVCDVQGQSLAVGGSVTPAEEKLFEFQDRFGALMLGGMFRADGAPNYLHGPMKIGYDTTIPANAIIPVAPNTVLTPATCFSIGINAIREEMGVLKKKIIVGVNGQAGQSIYEFDNDVNTGTGATTLFDNSRYWMQQAVSLANASGEGASIPYTLFVQGTADRDMTRATYLTALKNRFSEYFSMIETDVKSGQTVVPIITQNGGDTNTISTTELWGTCLAQLDFIHEIGGLIIPLYPYEIFDDNVHPDYINTALYSETMAWAAATTEYGQKWNILEPSLSATGTTVTLAFDIQADESLIAHDAIKYKGEGIDANLGFEAVGATITNVTLSGNKAIISCDVLPTKIRYAFQKQDVSGFISNKFTAHRGLVRTTSKRQSVTIPGKTLFRWIPTFELNV